jgi:hypothetical protein
MTSLKSKREELLQLIKDYIECSMFLVRALKSEYDTKGETLLRARRLNIVPKQGVLAEGQRFNFHGGGCFFEFENGTIDIDFGPNDRCDGFDSFRLYNFFNTSKKHQELHFTEIELQESLKGLIMERKVIQLGVFPNPNLYYLIDEIG